MAAAVTSTSNGGSKEWVGSYGSQITFGAMTLVGLGL